MIDDNTTPFHKLYNRFLAKVVDDMYLEFTREDTEKDLETILLSAIPLFEFPRFPLFHYDVEYQYLDDLGMVQSKGRYNIKLTEEEVDILTDGMVIEWLRRQIASVENTRMKYSGSDFKFTSQANHLDKLMKFRKDCAEVNKKKQRLYKRRKIDPTTGMVTPNLSKLAGGAINERNN